MFFLHRLDPPSFLWSLALIIVMVCVFRSNSRKQRRKAVSVSKWESSVKILPTSPGFYIAPITQSLDNIIRNHADCTSEVIYGKVWGEGKVDKSLDIYTAERVWLDVDTKGNVWIMLNDNRFIKLDLPDDSRLPNLLDRLEDVEVFMGPRKLRHVPKDKICLEDADRFFLIAFYKVPGVPPSEVVIG